MSNLTVRIPAKLKRRLQRLCARQDRSLSDLVRESLRRYVAQEELRAVRNELRPLIEARGVCDALLDASVGSQRHRISFADEATSTSKAKPHGVRGAQVWVKIGDPAPVDPSELTFLATDTRTPYAAAFEGADANKGAHYMLSWENTRGGTGPWSETASATIGA